MKFFTLISFSFLLISFSLCADINELPLKIFEKGEYFFYLQVLKFLNFRDKSRFCGSCKSFYRLLQNRLMPKMIREFLTCASLFKVPDEAFLEFEIIYKLARFLLEKKMFLGSKSIGHYKKTESRTTYLASIYRIIRLYPNFDFPLFTLSLLKLPMDWTFKENLMSAISMRPELYKDSLRIMAKDVFNCRREQLPIFAFYSKKISKLKCDQLIKFNSHELMRIFFKHRRFAILRLVIISVPLFIISPFRDDINITNITRYLILAAYVCEVMRTIYNMLQNISDEYENFK